MLRLLFVTLMVIGTAAVARSQSVSDNDRQAFESVIAAQIDAFRAGDGPRAYSYAAPAIRQIFPSPEHFMAMVMRGYQPVYRPRAFRFGEASFDSAGRPVQRVMIVGPDGLDYEAIYTMQQQPDGSWQINGCRLVQAADYGA